MLTLLLVGLGGGLGSIGRYAFSEFIYKLVGRAFPYGILMANIVGCLLIGMLAAFLLKEKMLGHALAQPTRLFLITGFLGGFTTFSSFSLDALTYFQKGELLKALLYIIVSVVVSMLAVSIGFYLIDR